jgi:hypothetical protein
MGSQGMRTAAQSRNLVARKVACLQRVDRLGPSMPEAPWTGQPPLQMKPGRRRTLSSPAGSHPGPPTPLRRARTCPMLGASTERTRLSPRMSCRMEPHTTPCPSCLAPALVTDAWCAACGASLRDREPLPAEWSAWNSATSPQPDTPIPDSRPDAPGPIIPQPAAFATEPVITVDAEPDYIPLRVPVTHLDRSPRGRLGSALRSWRLRVTSLL